MELVNLKTKYRIESRIFNILKKNNFKNIFKNIKYLDEFCECYIIIEEERLKINKIIQINKLSTYSKILLLKHNKKLRKACFERNIYLELIYNNWSFYREKLNYYL